MRLGFLENLPAGNLGHSELQYHQTQSFSLTLNQIKSGLAITHFQGFKLPPRQHLSNRRPDGGVIFQQQYGVSSHDDVLTPFFTYLLPADQRLEKRLGKSLADF